MLEQDLLDIIYDSFLDIFILRIRILPAGKLVHGRGSWSKVLNISFITSLGGFLHNRHWAFVLVLSLE